VLGTGESRSYGNFKPGTVYAPYMQCLWKANHTDGGSLRFEINDMALDMGGDWIFVLDGGTQQMSFTGKRCYFNNTEVVFSDCPPVDTLSSSLVVFFYSNHELEGAGFTFKVTAQ
jgi:hypothetical protein